VTVLTKTNQRALQENVDISVVRLRVGRILKFISALRAIIAGLIWSCGDTMYYKRKRCVEEEAVANYKLWNLLIIRCKYRIFGGGYVRQWV